MRRLPFAFFALLPLAAGAQNAKPRSSAEQSLINANSTLNGALATGDTAALAALLGGDLSYTDPSGAAQSRAQLLNAVAGGFRVQMTPPEVTRVRIDGNTGLLEFKSRAAASAADSAVVQSSAIYVLRAGRWQLISMHSTGERAPATAAAVVTPPLPRTLSIGRRMTARATGTFQVDTKPLTPYNTSPAAAVGRLSIDKQYHGAIEGTGKGEMLSAGIPASGSAGYVAIEYVTATIGGKQGSFALQHFGTMDKGTLSLTISVVPASGTGDLTGIAGTMTIVVENGKHSYAFDYSLPIQ